jgi:hypothetical protein
MPSQRLLIEDPDNRAALAPTKFISDDPSSLTSQHLIEALDKKRLVQDANLVPLIQYLRDGSIPYRVKPAR